MRPFFIETLRSTAGFFGFFSEQQVVIQHIPWTWQPSWRMLLCFSDSPLHHAMRYQGRITTWKDDKGFGFITPNGGGEQVFVHFNAFSSRRRRPAGNELVTYELSVDGKGRTQANAVAFVGERPVPAKAPGSSKLPPLFAVCFLLLVLAAVVLGRLPVAVLVLYVVASFLAFFAYVVDKSAALRNQWRISEKTLHLFALIGGWPGALAAQRLIRHKSSKASFLTMFWLTVAVNCGMLGWALSPSGSRTLEILLGAS